MIREAKMTKIKTKSRKPIITLLAALGVLALGIGLLFLPDETAEYLFVLIIAVSLLLGGISFMINKFMIKRYVFGIVGFLGFLLIGAVLLVLQYFLSVLTIAPTFLIGIIALLVGVVRAAICVNCFLNGYKGVFMNGLFAVVLIITGLMLVFSPLDNFIALRYIASIYMIIFSLTLFGDFHAEVSLTELDEDRMHRRMHISLPNLITAFKIKNMVTDIYKKFDDKEYEKKIYIEEKEGTPFDKVNLEINLHLTDPKGNQFGHMDIAIGDTVYSYGTYDKSKNELGGFISQGTYAEIPKLPYYKYCVDNCGDYIISYCAAFSEKQLNSVKDKLKKFKEYCEPLTLKIRHPEVTVPKPGKRYGDAGQFLVQFLNAKLFTVVDGPFKSYFGVNTNCVMFADWLLSDTGIDAVSLGGLRTPGAFFYMLENMFYRPNNRIIRKISYYSTEHIDEVMQHTSQAE